MVFDRAANLVTVPAHHFCKRVSGDPSQQLEIAYEQIPHEFSERFAPAC